jgi:hypothetical protein
VKPKPWLEIRTKRSCQSDEMMPAELLAVLDHFEI